MGPAKAAETYWAPASVSKRAARSGGAGAFSDPTGIRTPVSALRRQRPGPLDDGVGRSSTPTPAGVSKGCAARPASVEAGERTCPDLHLAVSGAGAHRFPMYEIAWRKVCCPVD